MTVLHTLICFFFLSLRDTLQDGIIGFLNPEIPTVTGKFGGNIRRECSFTFNGGRRIFCRDKCEKRDILVETTVDKAQWGRYSIEYKKRSIGSYRLSVSIKNLTTSDSGRYRCSLNRHYAPNSHEEFEIRVEDGPVTSRPTQTLRPLPATSASTPTTTHSFSSSSRSFTPSSTSPEILTSSEREQKPADQTTAGVLLFVALTLVGLIIALSAAVLIFCRKRTSKHKEPPVYAEHVDVTEANPVYEEIREEDRQSRAPPVQISTVYTLAKYIKPHAVESTDDYSFVTAAGPQSDPEVHYSQVEFSKRTAASLSSAPCGDADELVYSVPGVEASSRTEDTLYSTVSLL